MLPDGGFGLINFQGIVKPTFHAYRFLNQLGTSILASHTDHGIITRESTGRIRAILFHYPPEMTQTPPISYHSRDEAESTLLIGKLEKKIIRIEGLQSGQSFKVEKLAPGGRGDVISAWKTAGSPKNLSLKLKKQLLEFSSQLDSFSISADGSGILLYEVEMLPWTILSITQD